jgi:hypothetical protein
MNYGNHSSGLFGGWPEGEAQNWVSRGEEFRGRGSRAYAGYGGAGRGLEGGC